MEKPVVDKLPGVSPDDKLTILRSYRRARGLCEVCAEKWVRGHKCATTIQLHAMQEVWELFSRGESFDAIDNHSEITEPEPEQLLLALSHDTRMGSHGHRTIQF